MKRAVIVQGLGFGDEGKGATVDFLVRETDADVVVRYCGGSQAGHNVVLPDGRRHLFSQFGAGSLAGAATYLGEQMIIHLPAMHKEAQHLLELTGEDPFLRLLVHPRALVSTVYHQQLNRLRELSRGANRHGSCGHGIGETRNYWLKHGRDAVIASDLADRDALAGKLELLRQRVLLEAQDLIGHLPLTEHWRLDTFMQPVRHIARELCDLADPLELHAQVPDYDTAIFEGAQGVLLDEWRGFHPYTTWSTVTLHHALDMAETSGAEEVSTLGIVRAYMTRHGAGPLPTWSAELDERLADPGNPTNAWQGKIRRGWLDMLLLRYAAEAAGGPLDGLVINCLDHLDQVEPRICMSYTDAARATIEALPVSPAPWLAEQERLTALLDGVVARCEPISPTGLCDVLARVMAPIAMIGHGPTWKQKTLRDLRFRRLPEHQQDDASDVRPSNCRAISDHAVND